MPEQLQQFLSWLAFAAPMFILALGLVVFVHEFGHFQAARWQRIAIDTFSIGFGKTLLGWRDKQGVQWKIGALPLGGYVKFKDDLDPMSTRALGDYATPEEKEHARKQGLFHAQPVLARAIVVAAGPLTNFVFSILVFALLALIFGKAIENDDALSARVDSIEASSPAAAAGLQSGDVIIRFGDEPVESFGELKALVGPRAGETHPIVVRRGGEDVSLSITIGSLKEVDQTGIEKTRGILGVRRNTTAEERVVERLNPLQALGEGATRVWSIITSTGAYIGNIFSGRASAEHIAGPIGIFSMSGQVSQQAVSQQADFWNNVLSWLASAVTLAAILSVAVGIVNLLPVPILDGGHLLFYAAEAVQGKPLSAKTQEYGYRAGMALLVSLFLFATWNDINRVSNDLRQLPAAQNP